MWMLKLACLAVAALLAGGCSGGDQETSAPAPGSGAASMTPTATGGTTAVSADAAVCGSLGKVGRAFYEGAYTDLIEDETTAVQPIQLAAQLGALATTGAPEGEIDGSAAIAAASPAIRQPMIAMTRDADRLAQRFVDVAQGAVTGSDVTAVVNTFTNALVACSRAGYQPVWFDPAALLTP